MDSPVCMTCGGISSIRRRASTISNSSTAGMSTASSLVLPIHTRAPGLNLNRFWAKRHRSSADRLYKVPNFCKSPEILSSQRVPLAVPHATICKVIAFTGTDPRSLWKGVLLQALHHHHTCTYTNLRRLFFRRHARSADLWFKIEKNSADARDLLHECISYIYFY